MCAVGTDGRPRSYEIVRPKCVLYGRDMGRTNAYSAIVQETVSAHFGLASPPTEWQAQVLGEPRPDQFAPYGQPRFPGDALSSREPCTRTNCIERFSPDSERASQ